MIRPLSVPKADLTDLQSAHVEMLSIIVVLPQLSNALLLLAEGGLLRRNRTVPSSQRAVLALKEDVSVNHSSEFQPEARRR